MLLRLYPIFKQALISSIKMKSDILPHLRLVNTRDKGLNKLLKACFGQQLYKGEQCSNWEQRPLRKAQIIYASIDAYCLLNIYNFLLEQSSVLPRNFLESYRGRKKSSLSDIDKQSGEFSIENEGSFQTF
ncbi:unnamed protein product [Didymodactylos carnosus]|uniref:3'-5' exonuclease domain-containing protein n=1 Tax=Didymodactylos carnosus TaxID=1234261 RepID=A0A8S2F294_9BILA|nr:unnamed protein product [Didymodactylos carnosus]CAF4185375.1 unnamed protein product [Didymodactylos carnosus]